MDLSDCTPGLRIEVQEGPYAGWTGTVCEAWPGMGVIVASVDDWPNADRLTFDVDAVEPLEPLPDERQTLLSATGWRPVTEDELLANWLGRSPVHHGQSGGAA